jgi:sulfur carrier protein
MGKVRLKIKFIGFKEGDKTIDVVEGESYSHLMLRLGINPETVLVIKDSTPIPLDEKIEEGEITVMRVISGG